MDIFTILVFFLLVNSNSSQNLPNSKQIKLPSSFASKSPEQTLVISITEKNILVSGRRVVSLDDVLHLTSESSTITELKEELKFQYRKSSKKHTVDKARGLPVTIMGHENIHYEIIKMVLTTCRQENYTQIAFAAIQKAKKTEI